MFATKRVLEFLFCEKRELLFAFVKLKLLLWLPPLMLRLKFEGIVREKLFEDRIMLPP